MKCVALIVVLLLLVCSQGHSAIPAEHPIVGTWRIDRLCPETYEFRADGTRSATSAGEVLESKFEISPKPGAKGFYRFTDTVVRTNGKPDCSGELTPVGDVVTLFVRIPDPKKLFLCFAESELSCVGPFERLSRHAP